jgi:prepilin-type N-terminal cleavage/methylation domain-containing protein
MNQERGFTIVEVIVAMIVLTIGLLGLVTSAALVTRMLGRGQRSAVAASYAGRRLEMLRATACYSASVRSSVGPEVLMRGGNPVDTLKWAITQAPNSTTSWSILLTSKYPTTRGRWRTDTLETEVSCLF